MSVITKRNQWKKQNKIVKTLVNLIFKSTIIISNYQIELV